MIQLHRALFVMGCLILAIVLSACNNKPAASDEPSQTAVPAEVKPLSQDPLDLTFYGGWSQWTDEMFWSMYGNPLKAKFPYINLTFLASRSTDLDAYLLGGGQFDLMLVTVSDSHELVYKRGLQTDISDILKQRNIGTDHLEPGIMNIQKQMANGGINGLPTWVQIPVIVYNRDLFNRFGVPFPKPNATWNETYELAQLLSRNENGVQYYGLMTPLAFHLKTSQIPLTRVDPQTNKPVSNDVTKKVWENFARFYRIAGAEVAETTARGSGVENMFLKDQVLSMWPHFTNVARRLPDTVNWDVQNLPYYAEAPGVAPGADPYFVYVTEMSKHKEHAVEIAAFLTTNEIQKNIAMEGFTPIAKDHEIQAVFGKNNPIYADKNLAAFFPNRHAALAPHSQFNNFADSIMTQQFAKFAVGAKDLNTALRDYEEETAKAIEQEQKASGQ